MAFFQALLAQLEMDTMASETALKRIDGALDLAGQGDNRCYLSFIHRLRGEILLKRDPSNSGPAEDAFRTAIDVARQQRVLAVSVFKRRLRSPNSSDRPAKQRKRTPSSRPRSKAFRRRRKCPRSSRHRRCYRNWHKTAWGGPLPFPSDAGRRDWAEHLPSRRLKLSAGSRGSSPRNPLIVRLSPSALSQRLLRRGQPESSSSRDCQARPRSSQFGDVPLAVVRSGDSPPHSRGRHHCRWATSRSRCSVARPSAKAPPVGPGVLPRRSPRHPAPPSAPDSSP
jgi:hypothetical protein